MKLNCYDHYIIRWCVIKSLAAVVLYSLKLTVDKQATNLIQVKWHREGWILLQVVHRLCFDFYDIAHQLESWCYTIVVLYNRVIYYACTMMHFKCNFDYGLIMHHEWIWCWENSREIEHDMIGRLPLIVKNKVVVLI